nr:hypothetical protein [Acidobacteriota bacterium]
MHEPVAQTGGWLKSVLNGYYQYHAVQGNLMVLSDSGDRSPVTGLMRWFHALEQRGKSWGKSSIHGYPFQKLFMTIQTRVSTPAALGGKSKVITVCGRAASTGLCGGWLAMAIHTATALSDFCHGPLVLLCYKILGGVAIHARCSYPLKTWLFDLPKSRHQR